MTTLKPRLTFAFLIMVIATFSGTATASAQTSPLANAVAVGLDDAEGLLEPHIRMRVVLSDRPVAADALFGIAFPPVRDMAKRGELRGLMIEFDPKDRTSAQVTDLQRPADPTAFLRTTSISNSAGLWKTLNVDAKHISGRFVSTDDGLDLVVDAPITTDPVVATLTGAAVQASPFLKMLRARTQALAKGDLAAINALMSRGEQVQSAKDLPPASSPEFKANLAAYTKALDKASRVIVRGKTAVVLLPESEWVPFVREGADWKIAG